MSLPDPEESSVLPAPEENNALSEFTIKWEASLAEKVKEEAAEEKKVKDAATKELEAFKKEREMRLKKKAEINRENEKVFKDTIESELTLSNTWERVTKLVDLSLDTDTNKSDVARMRSIFIGMKNAPEATKA
tara:strand:- start:52 stop:450 length:399 start_codon:yes stop_codon:yes gene_type:complete